MNWTRRFSPHDLETQLLSRPRQKQPIAINPQTPTPSTELSKYIIMVLFKTNNENKHSIGVKLAQGVRDYLHTLKTSKSLTDDSVKTSQSHFDVFRYDEDDQTASISSESNASTDDKMNQLISHRMKENKNTSSKLDLFLHLSDSKNRLKYYMFEDDLSDHGGIIKIESPTTQSTVKSNNELPSNISRRTRLSTEAHPYMLFLDLIDDGDLDKD